jgi:hypothetical protein
MEFNCHHPFGLMTRWIRNAAVRSIQNHCVDIWSLAVSSLAPPDPIMVKVEKLQTLTDRRPLLARLTASND